MPIEQALPRSPLRFLFAIAGWAAFGLLLLLCIVSKGSTRVFTWPWTFYSQLLALVPTLLAAICLLRARSFANLGGGVLLACGTTIGISVAASDNPHFSFEAALTPWGALALTWWLARRIRQQLTNDRAVRATARLAGLALALPAMSSLCLWIPMIAPAMAEAHNLRELVAAFGSSRNPHPFGHWNYTGAYGLLTLPWFLALAYIERRNWRMLWTLGVVLSAILIISSASRGAVLGTVVMAGAALIVYWKSGSLSRRAGGWVVAGCVVGVVLFGATNERIRKVVTNPGAVTSPSLGDVQRLAMLQGGWLLAKERPWIGHGPGMVPFAYPKVRAQLVGGVETSYQLHNAYLHEWATTGIFGMAAAVWLGVILFRAGKRWFRGPAGPARCLALASAASLIGYAVMAATDYQLDVIGIAAGLCLSASWLLAAPAVNDLKDGGRRSVAAASNSADGAAPPTLGASIAGWSLLLSGVAALVILIPHWHARELHWTASAADSKIDSIGQVERLLRATGKAPWSTHLRNDLGLELARAAQASNDPGQRKVAREVLFGSLALDRFQEPIHANLGWLWLPDDPSNAATEFERAIALIPDRDTVHYGLALARLAMDDKPGAVRALAEECLVNPAFLASPLWIRADLAPLRELVDTVLVSLLDRSVEHPAMPRWRQSDLAYFRAFLRWWNGGPAPFEGELAGANAIQKTFFAAMRHPDRNLPSLPAPWSELQILSADRSTPQMDALPALDGARARIATGVTSIPALLRMKTPGTAGVFGLTIERGHYPLMHRNLDRSGYLDLAPRVADAFVERYCEPLFPPKGLIPGPVLKDLRTD